MVKKKEEQTTGKNIGKNMCKIEQKLQRKHLIALSFFLPLLVMTGCCIVFQNKSEIQKDMTDFHEIV